MDILDTENEPWINDEDFELLAALEDDNDPLGIVFAYNCW